ncbi:hypothetical protein J27TS7_00100 [Paenibacillus dendritiformis]|nr:hypothetical protein J27TS7_00100 [Paenibacillus dendritiformis]
MPRDEQEVQAVRECRALHPLQYGEHGLILDSLDCTVPNLNASARKSGRRRWRGLYFIPLPFLAAVPGAMATAVTETPWGIWKRWQAAIPRSM